MPAARSKRRAAIEMLIQRRRILRSLEGCVLATEVYKYTFSTVPRLQKKTNFNQRACTAVQCGRWDSMRRRAIRLYHLSTLLSSGRSISVGRFRGAAAGRVRRCVMRARVSENKRKGGRCAVLRVLSHLNHTAAPQAPACANTPYRPKKPGVWLITGEPHSPSWIAKPVMASIARRPL